MTSRDFTFNEKTGELSRGGTVIALGARQAKILSLLDDEYRATADIAFGAKVGVDSIGAHIKGLRKRITHLGLRIESSRGQGYRLVVGGAPKKWQPDIRPPVTIEDVRRSFDAAAEIAEERRAGLVTAGNVDMTQHRRLTSDQVEARENLRAAYNARDLTSTLCGDPPKGFSALDKQRGRE